MRTTTYANKLKRGTIVLINGEPCGITSKPKKAIDGTWIVFHQRLATGKSTYAYLTDAELADVAATANGRDAIASAVTK